MRPFVTGLVLIALTLIANSVFAQTSNPAPNPANQKNYDQVRATIDSRCGPGAWNAVLQPALRSDDDAQTLDFDKQIPEARQGILAANSCLGRYGFCSDSDVLCDQGVIELKDYLLYLTQNLRRAFAVTKQTSLADAANQQEFTMAIDLCSDAHIMDDTVVIGLARRDIEATLGIAEGFVSRGFTPPGGLPALNDLRHCASKIGSKHLT
jgi:hypothetical protein